MLVLAAAGREGGDESGEKKSSVERVEEEQRASLLVALRQLR